jgi:hypothetical protein
MHGGELVRRWKDPDERGDAAHPAGEITLDSMSGGLWTYTTTPLIDPLISWLVGCDGRTEPW